MPLDIFAEPQFFEGTIAVILLAIFVRFVITFIISLAIVNLKIFQLKDIRNNAAVKRRSIRLIIWYILRTGMWVPVYSILTMYFGQILHDIYISPFLLLVIMIVLDISRMAVLNFRFIPVTEILLLWTPLVENVVSRLRILPGIIDSDRNKSSRSEEL